MYRSNLIFVFFIVIAMIGCKKDSDDKVWGALTTDVCPSFAGYTGTDANGNIIGPIDTTDWGLYDTWNQCEKNLFSGHNFNTSCALYSDTAVHDTMIYVGVAHNPTSNFFQFFAGPPQIIDTSVAHSTFQYDVILLNQEHEKLFDTTIFNVHHVFLNFTLNSAPVSDTIFRIYYRITDINNCVRIGHGDIIRF